MRTLDWTLALPYPPSHNDACKKNRKSNCVLPDLSPHFRSMCLLLLSKESCRNVVSFYLHIVVSVSGTENNVNISFTEVGRAPLIHFQKIFFQNSNWIFTACVACKNQFQNWFLQVKNPVRQTRFLKNQVQIDK